MYKSGFVLLLCFIAACGEKKSTSAGEEGGSEFNYRAFESKFTEAKLPYTLSDTGLLNNKDTAQLRNTAFAALLGDSLKTIVFGKDAKPRFTALTRFSEKEGTSYFVVRAQTAARRTALLYVFDKDGQFGAAFPFMIPDADPATTQVSSVDRSFSITRTINRKLDKDKTSDQKDVHIYNSAIKGFTLIMTDAPDDSLVELINPIDTLKRSNPVAGDYTKGKRNLVSIRDGRSANEFTFFIHFEKEEGCTGELKGTALMTSSKTAVFRQSGNPCVLEFSFSGNSITLKEAEGCGSYRGARCLFEGSFSRKAAPKAPKKTGKKS
jgi:hypothetical protein